MSKLHCGKMRNLNGLILASSLLAVVNASPLHGHSPYVVKDRHPVPSGWEILARAGGDEPIHLQIGLRHGRFDELERHLHEGKPTVRL